MKSVTVKVGKDEHSLKTTAQTVGDALAEAKVDVDGNDIASVPADAPLTDGMKLAVVKVEVETVTKRRDVGFDTV